MNLRGVVVDVPEHAKARLDELNMAVGVALDQSKALAARANMVEAGSDLYQKIIEEQEKYRLKWNTLHRLLSSINQWLFQLRLPGGYLAPVTVAAQPAKGETAAEAVGKLRIQMASIVQEIAKVRSAALPVADQLALAEEFIAGKAMVGRPRIAIVRDTMQLSFADDVVTCKTDLLTILCWIAPKSLLDAIKREIAEGPPATNSLSAAVRIKKLAELGGQLLELERREIALLDESTLPRHDTNPLAYLMVEIREAAAAAA
jgi:hypothetical protein